MTFAAGISGVNFSTQVNPSSLFLPPPPGYQCCLPPSEMDRLRGGECQTPYSTRNSCPSDHYERQQSFDSKLARFDKY